MRYSVPRENRRCASWPEVAAIPALLEGNLESGDPENAGVLDLSWNEFRRVCRRAASQAAGLYAGEVGGAGSFPPEGPVVATGHQPELYHAGVWIKNHLASRLGAARGAASVNLVVDNDTPKHTGLVCPAHQDGAWRRAEVPLVSPAAELPFEEYPSRVERPEEFREKVRRIAQGTPFEQQAEEFLERLARLDGTGRSLGDLNTAVRLEYDREAGVSNAEVPLSRLSETAEFGAFAASVLLDAEAFAGVYNRALADYRRENRIRNAANPLPDLRTDGEAVEAPFWVWREGGTRRALFVRPEGARVRLFEGDEEAGVLDCGGFDALAASWRELRETGVKIRPRAITNTVFARLFLSDLFVHGIGGAKYDEVTDRLIRSYYSLEPPAYCAITATLTIPWEREPVDPGLPGRLKNDLRDLVYNPQRHLGGDERDGKAERLIEEKWRLVEEAPGTRRGRREKFLRIREINGELAGRIEEPRERKERGLREARQRLAEDEVLFDREYPFFLVGARRAAQVYDEALSALPAAPG